MAKKEYVKLWLSYADYFDSYSDVEVGRLVRAMIEYRASGEGPKFNGNERFVWPAIKRDIDESIEAEKAISDRNQQNGKLGGRPKKNPENPLGFSETQKSQGKGQGQGQGHGQGHSPPTPPGGEAGVGFERFWAIYPRKEGMEAARKAFAAAQVDIETLLAAVEAQKQSAQWQREGGRYVPRPAKWLEEGCWNDELPQSAAPDNRGGGTSAPKSGTGPEANGAPGQHERDAVARLIRECRGGDGGGA